MIYIRHDIAAACVDPVTVADLMGLQGKVYRAFANRKTLFVRVAGKGYFLKLHGGVGWKEIFKNLLQLKLPVLGAEFQIATEHHLFSLCYYRFYNLLRLDIHRK